MRNTTAVVEFPFSFKYPRAGIYEEANSVTVCEPNYEKRAVHRRMSSTVMEALTAWQRKVAEYGQRPNQEAAPSEASDGDASSITGEVVMVILRNGMNTDNFVRLLHGTSSDDLDRMYTLGASASERASGRASSRTSPSGKRTTAAKAPYINIAPDRSVTITEKPTWGAQVHGVQQAINKLTPGSSGPKALSTAYWNQGKVQKGETQVAKAPAATEVAKAPDFSRRGQTQTAQAPQEQPKEQAKQRVEGTRTAAEEQAGRRSRPGSQEYGRSPKHSEAARLAQGHDAQPVGDGDARSHLPHGAGGHEPVGDGTARASLPGDGVGGGDYSPYGSSGYVADSSVPGEIVIRVVLS